MSGLVAAENRARKALAALSFGRADALLICDWMSGGPSRQVNAPLRCPCCQDTRVQASGRHFLCGGHQTRVEVRNRPRLDPKRKPMTIFRPLGCGAQGDWVTYLRLSVGCSLGHALDLVDAYQSGRLTAETAHRFAPPIGAV